MASLKPNKKQQRQSTGDKNSRTSLQTSSSSDLSVQTDDNTLKGIRSTLDQINTKLEKLDTVVRKVDDIEADLYNVDGVGHRLEFTAEETHSNSEDVHLLKKENEELRKELNLVKAVVVRMDKKMTRLTNEVTDLKSRSMRDNLLIHNFAYNANENLMTDVPAAVKQHLNVDVEFVRIHRNGFTKPGRDTPVSITGRLVDRGKKDEILKAQKAKKLDNVHLPFHITAQEPISVVENRKRLYNISDIFRKNDIMTKVTKDKVVLPDGNPCTEEVKPIENADILLVNTETIDELEAIDTVSTPPVQRSGSNFFATATKAVSHDDVRRFHIKVCCDDRSAHADHRVLVYRFTNDHGKISDGYLDDGDYGVGRRLLKYMAENQILDQAIVVTHQKGSLYVGFERFAIMEQLVNDIANRVDDMEF